MVELTWVGVGIGIVAVLVGYVLVRGGGGGSPKVGSAKGGAVRRIVRANATVQAPVGTVAEWLSSGQKMQLWMKDVVDVVALEGENEWLLVVGPKRVSVHVMVVPSPTSIAVRYSVRGHIEEQGVFTLKSEGASSTSISYEGHVNYDSRVPASSLSMLVEQASILMQTQLEHLKSRLEKA